MVIYSYDDLERSFVQGGLPRELADAVLSEYAQVKKRFYENDYKPGSVHGGRFCEAVARVLEQQATGTYTALSAKLELDSVLNRLVKVTTLEDGLRLHMIRAMRFVYGVRNSRDTGHLKGGIDTNLQDASVVVSTLDWILAELVRVFHGVSAQAANEMIAGIVTKEVPVVEVLGGTPVVHADLAPMDLMMVFVYWANGEFVDRPALKKWLPARVNLPRELAKAQALHLVHLDGDKVFLTAPGKRYVEAEKLLHPAI